MDGRVKPGHDPVSVMPGLVPGIYVLFWCNKDVGAGINPP